MSSNLENQLKRWGLYLTILASGGSFGIFIGSMVIKEVKKEINNDSKLLRDQIGVTKDSLKDDSIAFPKWIAANMRKIQPINENEQKIMVTAITGSLNIVKPQDVIWGKKIIVNVPDSLFVKVDFFNFIDSSVTNPTIKVNVTPQAHNTSIWDFKLNINNNQSLEDTIRCSVIDVGQLPLFIEERNTIDLYHEFQDTITGSTIPLQDVIRTTIKGYSSITVIYHFKLTNSTKNSKTID